MNYLQQINEFYRWLESNQLPPNAISLWHALMNVNNGTRWKPTFTAAISTLESKTGCSKKAIFVARQILANSGLLRWESNGSNQAAVYAILPVSVNNYGSSKKTPKKPEIFDTELSSNKNLKNDLFNQNIAGIETITNSEMCQNKSLLDTQSGTQSGMHYGSQSMTQYGSHQGTHPGPINKEKEREKEKEKNSEPKGSLSSIDDDHQLIRKVFIEYNSICKNCTPAKILTDKRMHMIRARLVEYGFENVKKMIAIASRSDFLAGSNRRKWVATIDFLFGPVNFVKVMEGNYNNRATMHSSDNYNARPSSLEIIAETYNNMGF